MPRSPVEDLQEIVGVDSDPGLVSSTLVKLIYASREFEAKVFDSDARTGTYVVVLEGVLDSSERGDAPADHASGPAETGPVAQAVMNTDGGGSEPSTGG